MAAAPKRRRKRARSHDSRALITLPGCVEDTLEFCALRARFACLQDARIKPPDPAPSVHALAAFTARGPFYCVAEFLFMLAVASLGISLYFFFFFQPDASWQGYPPGLYFVFATVCLGDLYVCGIVLAFALRRKLPSRFLNELRYHLSQAFARLACCFALVVTTISFSVMFGSHPDTHGWDTAYLYMRAAFIVLALLAFALSCAQVFAAWVAKTMQHRQIGTMVLSLLESERTLALVLDQQPVESPPRERSRPDSYEKLAAFQRDSDALLASSSMKLTYRGGRELEITDPSRALLVGTVIFGVVCSLRPPVVLGERWATLARLAWLDLHVPLAEADVLGGPVFPKRTDAIHGRDVARVCGEHVAQVLWVMLGLAPGERCSLNRMRQTVLELFRAHNRVRTCLHDLRVLVGSVEAVVSNLTLALVLLLALVVFQVNISKLWVVFSSIVLSFTFAFGPTMQNVFDSVVWIFAVRAFDIGDHLQLGREEVFVEARSLGVLGTHMRRWDGGVFFVPNASLRSDMRIINVDRKERRSKPASMHGAAVEVRELLSLGAPPGFATKVVPGL